MEIIDYRRGDAKGGILVNGKDQYIAVTELTSKKFKSLRGAQKFLESYGYRPSAGNRGTSIGKSRRSRKPLVRGFHDEWWVVIEHNYPRRTDRMIDYDYGKGNMLDRVLMKIIDWAYNNNDKGLIKSLNQMKSVEDFLEKNASKYDWGYSTDIYGDNSWEIIRLTKDNISEMGERYPDIYDRFSEEDFE